MKCNVGGGDRIFRIVVGLVLIALGIFAPVAGVWKIVFFVLAAIALGTAFLRYCPINQAIGLNTCKTK